MFREVQKNLQTQTWKASHAWRDTHPACSLLEFLLQQSCSPFFAVLCHGLCPASWPWVLGLTQKVWHCLGRAHFLRSPAKRLCLASTASCDNISCLKPSMQIISAMAWAIPESHIYPEVRSVQLKSECQNVLFWLEMKPLSRMWEIHVTVPEHHFTAILNSVSSSYSFPVSTKHLNCSPSGGCCVCFH